MAQNEHEVKIIDGAKLTSGRLTYGEDAESAAAPYWPTVESDGEHFAASGEDLFECLLAVRRLLEERGMQICVNGASLDVWPS
jgi:hypothetical protein